MTRIALERIRSLTPVIFVLILMISTIACSGNASLTDTTSLPAISITPTSSVLPTLTTPSVISPTVVPLKVIIYTDLQCGACGKLHFEIEPELRRLYVSTGKAEIETRLVGSLGNDSLLAAEAVFCARDQGKSQEYMNALFEAWQNNDTEAYNIERLVGLSDLLCLDQNAFKRCLDSGIGKAELDRNMSLANADGIEVLPAMLVGDNRVEGFKSLDTYIELIENALINTSD